MEEQTIDSMLLISCTPGFMSTALSLGMVKNRVSSPSVVLRGFRPFGDEGVIALVFQKAQRAML